MKTAFTLHTGIGRITVFTILVVAALVGLPTAFAISSEQSLNKALEEKARIEQSLAAIETQPAQNTPEPEPSDEPFAPEHPSAIS